MAGMEPVGAMQLIGTKTKRMNVENISFQCPERVGANQNSPVHETGLFWFVKISGMRAVGDAGDRYLAKRISSSR